MPTMLKGNCRLQAGLRPASSLRELSATRLIEVARYASCAVHDLDVRDLRPVLQV